jgi:putative peptide zinc metalloprotease protein
MNIDLKAIKEKYHTRYIAIDASGSIFKISEMLFVALSKKKENLESAQIAEILNTTYVTESFNQKSVDELITKAYFKLSGLSGTYTINNKYIYFNKIIIGEGKFNYGYNFFKHLFSKPVFFTLLCLSISYTSYFFFASGFINASHLYYQTLKNFSIGHIVLFYISFLLIVLFHEIGHASASFFFKVVPKEIGAGLYFIMPVFYTNVTSIWTLNLRSRVVVNLGGIYFQLILNCIFITFFYFNIQFTFLLSIIVANTISLLSALNPFFRYDGFWIYSDCFNLPNLKKHALLFFIKPQYYWREQKRKEFFALFIYSICNGVFWFIIIEKTLVYSVSNIERVYNLIVSKIQFSAIKILEISSSLLVTVLLIFIVVNMIKTSIKTIYDETTQLY